MLRALLIRSSILILFSLIIYSNIYAQEHDENHDHEEERAGESSGHHEFKPWRIGMGIGHSYLPAGTHIAEDVSFLILPTIGLDIQYWFNQRFGLALKNELEVISYVVETNDGNEIEREYPLISVLATMYKLRNGLTFYLGAGIEYEKHQNFFIGKAGIEYEFELGRHWDVTPEFYYFNKDADFGGVGLSITFGKRF